MIKLLSDHFFAGPSSSVAALVDLLTDGTCLAPFNSTSINDQTVYATNITFTCHRDVCTVGTQFVVQVEVNSSTSNESVKVGKVLNTTTDLT